MVSRAFHPIDDLLELNRALDQRFGLSESSALRMSLIPLDMYETRDEVIVQAYLPGFAHDQVEMELEGHRLTIKGERSAPNRDGMTWLHVESPYGTVFRTISIGPKVDTQKIEAAWHEGMLIVRLPKVDQARPKSIPIQVHRPQVQEAQK